MTIHDDFGGLGRDLTATLSRRRALGWLGAVSAAGVLAACTGEGTAATTTAGETTTTTGAASSTTAAGETTATSALAADLEASAGAEIPDETAGPYPADGSNGPNVLVEADIVRSDLTTSFAGLSGTAAGQPITFDLAVVDAATGSPLPGAAVYLWHCTADGRYSIYEVEDQNYLRGVQAADDAGRIRFTSVFPGCYRGRWPHAHFEVYESLDAATAGSQAVKTSQLAMPEADCATAYADGAYGDSLSNLGDLSLDTDGIFSDGWSDQLAVVTGDPSAWSATLLIRV